MQGIAASPGIAIGKLFIKFKNEYELQEDKIGKKQIEREIKKLEIAISQAKQQLHQIKNDARARVGDKKAEIFQAHLMLLDDPELIPEIKDRIREKRVKAEFAVDEVINQYAQEFINMENEYMQQRAADIRDVGRRLINILSQKEDIFPELNNQVIIAARSFTPSDTVRLDKKKILAFITEEGSAISHSAIIARSLGIPAVVGLGEDRLLELNRGQQVIVDGNQGRVIVDPSPETLSKYRKKLKNFQESSQQLQEYVEQPSQTKSGQAFKVKGNAVSLEEIDVIKKYGGKGIGLFRTEFIYMKREQLPTEQEQFEIYKEAAEKVKEEEVVIRTLDIGGDMELSYLDLPEEMNPFLGFRALRFCLEKKEIFRTQLRAILRASAFGNIKVMYPMVASFEEVREANKLLESVKRDLKQNNIKFDNDLQVGIMIETPAAVFGADKLAELVDFFSIGTNDLIQYTMAADRTNERVADLSQPYYPFLLTSIKMVIEKAHKQGIQVAMCGEMAGDELLVPFLLGIKLDEFSTAPVYIPRIKKLLSRWTYKEAREVAKKVLTMKTAQEVKNYLREIKR